MKEIKIKPLSVNKCWQGRRFKTQDYKNYEDEVFYLLPKLTVPAGNLLLRLRFGLSNRSNDIDNSIKPFLDILQKVYGFNDKRVYRLEVDKVDVGKGGEYIQFEIERAS